ncbi:MAG: DnaJ domain-containing protein [Myxococcales bacterium]|nr:DnaJ domain-containing protein [Myxococcales bacterium]
MRPLREEERRFAPRRVDGVEVASLPLTPLEAFVLCQLDGATDLDEVSVVTSLSPTDVGRIVQRLVGMGVVRADVPRPSRITGPTTNPARQRDPRRDDDSAAPNEDSVRLIGARRAKVNPSSSVEPAAKRQSGGGERALVEVELDPERRALIDDTHSRLETLTHYQLLDVAPRAERKEIKAAYFSIISTFHPDKYFGKQLGTYQKKLSEVFTRLTHAYEVLSRKASREEYDRYLKARRATRSFDAVLTSLPPPGPSQTPPSTAAAASTASSTPDAKRSEEPPPASVAEAAPAAAPGSAELGSKPAERSEPPPAAPPRGAGRAEMARLEQAQKFRLAGLDALRDGHYVSAVNAFRIAMSITPEDSEIVGLLLKAEQTAARELAEKYLARAQYEERSKDFVAAAQSYERVAAGRPKDPKPLDLAARSVLRAGTDPRRAVGLARRAVALDPRVTAHSLTLAEAYQAAGMLKSALAEAERARSTAPKDEAIAALCRRLKKLGS